MPAYVIEFQSGEAPHRRRFTLDDHRPLRDQLEHVLAELEREGIVLRGGPTDELVARWHGRDLDGARTPEALGLTPDRPLELRMQRRRQEVRVPTTPERPPERFTPRGVYAAAAWGLLGGVIAWGVDALVVDRDGPLFSDASLDVVAGALWAGCVAACATWGAARRVDRPALGASALGLVGGAVLGGGWVLALLALLAPATVLGAPTLSRMGAWLGLAGGVAAVLLLSARMTAPPGRARQAAWAVPAALGAGVVAGLLPALPGAEALWQGLAFALTGAGVAAALAAATAHATPAVLQLETLAERPVGVASLREWELHDGAVAWVRDVAPGAEPGAVQVAYAAGRCRVQGDGAGGGARELRHGDRLTIGRSHYRFRRRQVA